MTIIEHGGKTPKVHPSCYIASNATLIGDLEIGDGSNIWPHAVLRADINRIVIGRRCSIQDGCLIHGSVDHPTRLGDQVLMGHGAVVHGCNISDNVLVGIRAVVLDGAKIGSWSIIGAGSVVTEDTELPEGSLALGIPARPVRKLEERHRNRISLGIEEYVKLAQTYKASQPS